MNNAARFVCTVAVIVAVALVAGCADAETGGTGEDAASLASGFSSGSAIEAAFTDSRAAGMKGVGESDALRLFVDDETGEIAVLHKRSGEMWRSNPLDRDNDTLAAGTNKDLLSAQLRIEFYNRFGQTNTVNSYTDSVAHKQLSVEPLPNGARVTYLLGTSKKTIDDLPMQMSNTRFEALLAKLDNAGQRALRIGYTADEDNEVYVRSDGALSGLQLTRALQAFEDAGYTADDLQIDIVENNLNQTKAEPRVFVASIEYIVDGDSLLATMPVDDIRYPDEYPIGSISFLSLFGAGGTEERGSILVPDGSGALIHFNNGKTRYPSYQQPVYGADQTIERVDSASRTQHVRLPVFGIIRERGAFLGIIEQGDAAAAISADVSGRLNSYNYVHPTFTVLNKGELTLIANEQQRSLPRFQENPTQSDFAVRYVFFDRDEASYSDMAAYYQQYLLRNNGLRPASARSGDDMPFYMELIGSIDKKKHVAGIPYRALEPLTTFEQAESIVMQAQQRGIADIRLKYAGWFNQGLDHKVPDGIKPDRAIGGSGGLERFAAFAEAAGVSLYPDVAVLNARTSKGFNEMREGSRTLRNVPAEIYPLNLALNRRDRTKSPAYVISPRVIGGYVEEMMADFSGFGMEAISLRDLADKLNSDFRRNNQIDREQSRTVSVQAMERIYGEHLSIMADGGNAYALPYVTDITNAPTSNSRFKIEDESIPFYQMVVRGFVDYAGAPYNLSSYTDVRQYVLKSLEYGSGVYVQWI